MRRHYITESEYEQAEFRIYNNLPVFMAKDISQIRSKFNKETAERVTIEGEEYVQLEQMDHYIVTSYARLINTRTGKIVKPMISRTNIHWPLDRIALNSERDFKEYGWRFDYRELITRYIKKGWPYRTSRKDMEIYLSDIIAI